MATKKPVKDSKRSENRRDHDTIQDSLEAMNPMPSIVVGAIKLIGPPLARMAVRTAISYMVSRRLLRSNSAVSETTRAKIVNVAEDAVTRSLKDLLATIKVQG